jgi:hypothetical protein
MIPIRRETMPISAKRMLIFALGLMLMAAAAAAGDAPYQKIDPGLALKMSAAGDEKIPVIVMLKGEGNLEPKDRSQVQVLVDPRSGRRGHAIGDQKPRRE